MRRGSWNGLEFISQKFIPAVFSLHLHIRELPSTPGMEADDVDAFCISIHFEYGKMSMLGSVLFFVFMKLFKKTQICLSHCKPRLQI